MKRILLSTLIIAGLAFSTTSCSKAKDGAKKTTDAIKNTTNKAVETTKKAVEKTTETIKDATSNTAQITKGKELFTSKTCATCHGIDKKILGPSVKDIVVKYDASGANMVKFLKGNSKAIVDTDPGQVAIMKANIDGFLKDMKAEELQAITAYMRSVSK